LKRPSAWEGVSADLIRGALRLHSSIPELAPQPRILKNYIPAEKFQICAPEGKTKKTREVKIRVNRIFSVVGVNE